MSLLGAGEEEGTEGVVILPVHKVSIVRYCFKGGS